MKALAEVVAAHPQLVVFSDEIYEKLVYDGLKFVSFATLHPSLLEQTLTFNCHSKSFAMTGWRIGYIGGPKPAIDAINKLQSQMTSHITSFTQLAGGAALTDPRGPRVMEQMRAAVRAARPAHVGAAQCAAEGHLRPARRGPSIAFPTSAQYFGKTAGARKSPTRSASPPPCWSRRTSPLCRATTAALTRMCG